MRALTFCLLLLLITGSAFSQVIKDAATKMPVPFCAVGIKGTAKGCLGNEDGAFRLGGLSSSDTLVITNIGYERREVPAAGLNENSVIYLVPRGNTLQEVVVYDSDDYLYELFEQCRKKLLRSPEHSSKSYFALESEIGGQPVEMLECYHNARSDNASIKQLDFKNGRVGLAPYENRYFVNRNTSKAICFLSLVNGSERMPALPFQLSKRKLKKSYRLALKQVIGGAEPTCVIAFEPLNASGGYFGGEAWITRNSASLQKITFSVAATQTHPFVPYSGQYDKIESVSMQVSRSYAGEGDNLKPEQLYFNYQLMYHHNQKKMLVATNNDTTFEVSCRGIIYFYDFGRPFYPPRFAYDEEAEDYRKITSLTYNDWFWTANNTLTYSEQRKKKMQYFQNHGLLFNYKGGLPVNKTGGVFENNYITWSSGKRLSLKKNGIKNDTLNMAADQQFLSQRYKINAQIFLDINPSGDSLQHYSATVFDVYESFYNIPEEPVTNCFINIYFDLVEMERRKMESAMAGKKLSVPQMDALYQQARQNIDKLGPDYFDAVSRGKNLPALEKWNVVVKQNLGIDNFELFKIEKPKR